MKTRKKCPMTKANQERYKISDKAAERFCSHGCSVICEEEFALLRKVKKHERAGV